MIEKETNNLHGQTKKICDLSDNSIGPSSDINSHPCQKNSSSSELKDNHSLTTRSQSSAVDMDASYRSDHSLSSTTTRDSTFSRVETPRRSNTLAVSRSGVEGRSRIQGIVTPLMRSTEKTPMDSGDPSHSTPKRQLPLDILRDRLGNTFSRSDKHRHTLPAKMSLDRRHSKSSSSKYYSPETSSGHRGVAPPGSGYSRPPQMAPYGQHSHSVSETRYSSSRDYDNANLRSHLNSSITSEARGSDQSRQRPRSGDTKVRFSFHFNLLRQEGRDIGRKVVKVQRQAGTVKQRR